MTNKPDVVSVWIDGCSHDDWTSYSMESDLLTPADAWSVRLSQSKIAIPPNVVVGAKVKVRMNNDTVLSGILDERTFEVSKGRHSLDLHGRDNAGILLDCSSEIMSRQAITLDNIIANIVRPLGIAKIRIDADTTMIREKVVTEPGECAWDSLRRAAEANGLWPWFEPDGTLVVGGPKYDTPPVAALIIRADGMGNNVLSIGETSSITDRFSQVSVYGQCGAFGYGDGERDGRNNIKDVVRDTGVTSYRPKILFDFEAINKDIAHSRGLKFISDSRIKSYGLTATVAGHRTDDGILWKPGQRVYLKIEPLGLDGVYFLMARRFTGDKRTGSLTQLTLKEDRMWVLSAHPSKRKHRRGKNSLPGQIVDLPGPP